MSEEVFYFKIVKPDYSLKFSIESSGMLEHKETVSNRIRKMEKILTEPEMKQFFSELEAFGFFDWPPNLDCCACDDSTWTVMADYRGKKKHCFGVFGFEPDTWPDLLRLVETCAGVNVNRNS